MTEMRTNRLVRRSLVYYWRANVAVIAGVATAVAVLAGALLVGDSVRGSLRDLVEQRLGRADLAVERAKATGRNADPAVRQEIAKLLILSKTAEWTARRARAAPRRPHAGRDERRRGAARRIAR